jgi:predicted dehydrogenase
MAPPVNVALIGSGPWARAALGPALAAGPDTRLTGVWSRSTDRAAQAATALGVQHYAQLDALLDTCDAVAVAVAPDAQPALAARAARAGKALLLEKPLALDLDAARRLVDEVEAAGVGALVTLTYRFHPGLAEFEGALARFEALGGRGCFLSGAYLPTSPYANGWRMATGALLDVGPHLLDLHEVALGEIVDIAARGDVHGWISLTLRHASGATSEAAICCRTAIASRTEVEVFGPSGSLLFDGRAGDRGAIGHNLHTAFAAVARGGSHPANLRRALHLQELLDRATRSLRATP